MSAVRLVRGGRPRGRRLLATVGAHILERRTELGFIQRDLAALAGVDRAFLARVKRGLRNPSVVLLAKLLRHSTAQ